MRIFGANFEFCIISLLVMLKIKILEKTNFDWTIMGGATIVPRSVKTKWNKKMSR
jgi:hypothetical protein